MADSPESPESIEALTAELLARADNPSAVERLCGIVAGALRFALRTPEAGRRLLLRWQVEQVAGDALESAVAEQPRAARRRVCIECGRPFPSHQRPFRGGWCDATCFAHWSADLPPEPPAR
ncbi:MAG: hypothetical protein ACYDCQ_00110 [Dehalococcoidia bacterium]